MLCVQATGKTDTPPHFPPPACLPDHALLHPIPTPCHPATHPTPNTCYPVGSPVLAFPPWVSGIFSHRWTWVTPAPFAGTVGWLFPTACSWCTPTAVCLTEFTHTYLAPMPLPYMHTTLPLPPSPLLLLKQTPYKHVV